MDYEDGLYLYRSTDGENFERVRTFTANTGAGFDVDLMSGETYSCYVTAFKDGCESAPTNTVSVTTELGYVETAECNDTDRAAGKAVSGPDGGYVYLTFEDRRVQWAREGISYYIDSEMSLPNQQIVQGVLGDWSRKSDNLVSFDYLGRLPVSDKAPRKDGRNVFYILHETDWQKFRLGEDVLGVAYYWIEENGEITNSDIFLNAVKFSEEGFNIRTTLAHEIGHLLGLMHVCDNEDALMYPVIPPGKPYNIDEGALAGIQTLYSASETVSLSFLNLDLDPLAGDQRVHFLAGTQPESVVPVQVFGNNITNAAGFDFRFEYDTTQVAYDGFEAGNIPLNAGSLAVDVGRGYVEVGFATAANTVTFFRALLGTVRFRADVLFSSTTIRMVNAKIRQPGRIETLDTRIAVDLTKDPCPDFDCDGKVGFSDFMLFAQKFGSKQGDGRYENRYDLDFDSEIGFLDFIIFTKSYNTLYGREITCCKPAGGSVTKRASGPPCQVCPKAGE